MAKTAAVLLASVVASLLLAAWKHPAPPNVPRHARRVQESQDALIHEQLAFSSWCANGSRLVIVDKSGWGHFRTVQAAVNSIPAHNKWRYTILITPGFFQEKVTIPRNKAHITLQGLGHNSTIISWHDTASTLANSSHEGAKKKSLGTLHSATVAVNAPDFIARGVTFQNSAPPPEGGMLGHQAVALQVSGDRAAFYDCEFIGAQDTLYDHRGRHYFKNCYIEGSIDFIFGDGLSLYKECEIHAIGSGYITAQKRQNASDETGFSFVNCKVTGASHSQIYLGRAWGPYSRVVYAASYIDESITPKGWSNWGDWDRQETVFYGEYDCIGPGANGSSRVSWSRVLNHTEAQRYMSLSFIGGEDWLPYK